MKHSDFIKLLLLKEDINKGVRSAVLKEEDWWEKLDPDEQAAYIKAHPDSVKAQQAKKKAPPTDDKGEEKPEKKAPPTADKGEEKPETKITKISADPFAKDKEKQSRQDVDSDIYAQDTWKQGGDEKEPPGKSSGIDDDPWDNLDHMFGGDTGTDADFEGEPPEGSREPDDEGDFKSSADYDMWSDDDDEEDEDDIPKESIYKGMMGEMYGIKPTQKKNKKKIIKEAKKISVVDKIMKEIEESPVRQEIKKTFGNKGYK